MRKNSTLVSLVVVMALCLLASDAYAASPTVVGFDGGSNDGFHRQRRIRGGRWQSWWQCALPL